MPFQSWYECSQEVGFFPPKSVLGIAIAFDLITCSFKHVTFIDFHFEMEELLKPENFNYYIIGVRALWLAYK